MEELQADLGTEKLVKTEIDKVKKEIVADMKSASD